MPSLDTIYKNFKLPLTSARKELIKRAFDFAQAAHQGQKRKSGEDYFNHPVRTAVTLGQIGMGSKTLAAGLLHDVPEDTAKSLEDVEKEFGSEIARMVDGITKLGKLKLRGSREEYYLENLRKMFLAMAEDIRVVIIKLADRLDNMRTLDALPPEKQERIARETLDIFAPIANRLGIGEIKGQLEDLCFKHLDPENYRLVKEMEEKNYAERKKTVDVAIAEIKKELAESGIKVISINGRVKYLFSLFQKLKRKDMDINQIYDLIAIRVIVPELADCYETLGIIHKKYHPMIGRIKDYISLPKPNGYQSLHTAVFGPEGRIIEIQIRTEKMHREAEFGIASHWLYSEKFKSGWNWRRFFSKAEKSQAPEKEIEWVRQLREWQKEIGHDDEEFVKRLKIEFFKNHIFAFTPKGDIIQLPEDATVVDFAYAIHSAIGNKAVGAKADGKMVPLDYTIHNGQVIEVLTSKNRPAPSEDWLNFVKTSGATAHIRRELRKKDSTKD